MLRPIRALFLGPPGSGKGTLTNRLIRDIPSLTTISSGDVLRQQIAEKSEVGLVAQDYIQRGALVPDDVMVSLITGLMGEREYLRPSASWILDGFPRTSPQATLLDKKLDAHGSPMNCVVWLNVPKEVILERIRDRWIHAPSGRLYNLTYNPPKVPGRDDVTGEPLTKRSDDTEELFLKRFADYQQETYPLMDHYRSKGILHELCGTSSDELYPEMYKFIKKEFAQDPAPTASP